MRRVFAVTVAILLGCGASPEGLDPAPTRDSGRDVPGTDTEEPADTAPPMLDAMCPSDPPAVGSCLEGTTCVDWSTAYGTVADAQARCPSWGVWSTQTCIQRGVRKLAMCGCEYVSARANGSPCSDASVAMTWTAREWSPLVPPPASSSEPASEAAKKACAEHCAAWGAARTRIE